MDPTYPQFYYILRQYFQCRADAEVLAANHVRRFLKMNSKLFAEDMKIISDPSFGIPASMLEN